jgi:FkbM family methyltransferase
MSMQYVKFSPNIVKEVIRTLFYKMGNLAAWLAKFCLFLAYPFPRIYCFISHAAGLTYISLRRIWRVNSGPLKGLKLSNMLEVEIVDVLRNRMQIQCCNLLEKIDLTGQTVLDIGGSYGFFALFLSKLVGDKGSVFSFEPDWESFARLNNNILINRKRNIIPVPLCISDISSGFIKWQSFPNQPWKNKILDNSSTAQTQIYNIVPVTTVDNFVENNNIVNKIGFIKIDVEGAEHEVLQGSIKLLRETRPLILCELHGEEIGNRVCDFLNDQNYQYELVEYINDHYRNIIAFPVDQADLYKPLIQQ